MLNDSTTYIRSSQDQYEFSVLIPSWNNLAYLQLCVSSIIKNSSRKIQIIVFVNEGSDGTLEWLNQQEEIDFIHSEENVGICHALNECRPLVKSDYIIYMNDDMYACPNWDEELHNEIAKLPDKLFMLSSTMIEPDDTGNHCVIVKNYGRSTEEFDESQLLNDLDNLKKEDWNGSTWPPNLIHREVWDLAGGMSVEFSPGMYSDPDLSMKLYQAGVRVFKGVGKSKVYHFGSKSTKRLGRSKGRELFLRKWGITPSVFSKKILKAGEPFQVLPEQVNIKKERLLGKIKMLMFP